MEHVVKGAIIPYYDAFLDEWADEALVFSSAMRVLRIPTTPRARKALTFLNKSGISIRIIYT